MNIREDHVLTRKPHRCFTCSHLFPPGTIMAYHVGVWEGYFTTYYLCGCCEKFMNMNPGDFEEGFGEGEFSGEHEYKQFKQLYYGTNTPEAIAG